MPLFSCEELKRKSTFALAKGLRKKQKRQSVSFRLIQHNRSDCKECSLVKQLDIQFTIQIQQFPHKHLYTIKTSLMIPKLLPSFPWNRNSSFLSFSAICKILLQIIISQESGRRLLWWAQNQTNGGNQLLFKSCLIWMERAKLSEYLYFRWYKWSPELNPRQYNALPQDRIALLFVIFCYVTY